MERRSRQRKVNYSQLLADDSGDSEDDFVCAPPLKKSKEKKKRKEAPVSSNASDRSLPVRLSRDEKMFNRQVEKAISISKTTPSDVEIPTFSEAVDECVKIEPSSECTVKTQTDSDFIPQPEEVISSDESFNEEASDSDFNSSPPNKKTTKKPAKMAANRKQSGKKQLLKHTAIKPPDLTQPAPSVLKSTSKDSTPSTKQTISKFKPSNKVNSSSVRNSPALGTSRMKPKWTPPSCVGSSSTTSGARSPRPIAGGTPVIRVGLSRNARVKPLHAKS